MLQVKSDIRNYELTNPDIYKLTSRGILNKKFKMALWYRNKARKAKLKAGELKKIKALK